MIGLKKLIVLQLLFVILTLVFAWINISEIQQSGKSLTASPILPTLIMIFAYLGSLFLAALNNKLWYRATMLIAILIFGVGGVLGNIVGFLLTGMKFYTSIWTWAITVIINIYGTILNSIAFSGRFKPLETN